MLSRLLLVLVLLPTVTSLGSIVENINRHGETYLYLVRGGEVLQFSCPGSPSVEVNPGDCTRVGKSTIAVKRFETMAREAAQPEITELKNAVAPLETALVDSVNDLKRNETRLTELRALIAELTPHVPQPPELADYLKNEATLVSTVASLESRITSQKADIATAKQIAQEAESGGDALFGSNHQLEQDFPVAIATDSTDFARARPYVRQFFHLFATVTGMSYGKNTWYDAVSGRVWLTDFRSGSWNEISGACPEGYEQPDWDTPYAGQEAAERLQEASVFEETGFERQLDFFWGSWCHSYSRGTTWLACDPTKKAWQYQMWDIFPHDTKHRPWVYGAEPQDGRNSILMCISSKPDPN